MKGAYICENCFKDTDTQYMTKIGSICEECFSDYIDEQDEERNKPKRRRRD